MLKLSSHGVLYDTFENIPYPHGFSTRLGGVSQACHLASLNLGYGRGEADEIVDENYRRFLKAVFDTDDLARRAMAPQIHSNILHYAEKGGLYPEGDGFYTDQPGVILTVKVADCVPILLADKKRPLIAALHAGWRGTVAGIAEKGVEALVRMGAERCDIAVAIGQSIHACCYEVGEDFLESVKNARGPSFANAHIKAREGRLFADVAGMNRSLLLGTGILEENIVMSPYCTACESERFFSHRASKGKRGTMVGAIMIPEML